MSKESDPFIDELMRELGMPMTFDDFAIMFCPQLAKYPMNKYSTKTKRALK